MELTYRQAGDYLLPNISAPERPQISKYGMMRLKYLRQNRKALYTAMKISGKLNEHLETVNSEATEMMEKLVSRMAKDQGVDEKMKTTDQMKWVGLMNNIRQSAEEIVLNEVVYR